ncbi:histidine phosphatase family protein [Acinetobacter sp. P8-3-8]|uniref:histidine phosphatase family protein n=1 Tax=Acinetobacter sp. P8-3-8 TaxID=1029823 RepID=UPI0002485CEE|nr:histidine phosphatase family protein [Acinetobacter sp. P8-3-8]
MAIYLIRHAESVGNVNGRTASHASIELTDLGHEQARKLLTQLPCASHVYISAFKRTKQAAQPLLDRDQLEPEIFAIEEFSYLSDSRCQNTTLEERKPWVNVYWKALDVDYIDENDAESFRSFYQRVQSFRQHLLEIQSNFIENNLMVFSHGQFLKLFQMLSEQDRVLSASLMSDFRYEMIHHPIQNTEFFILDLRS